MEGTPEDIFPLYCPVKETEQCEGWDPSVVYSETGGVGLPNLQNKEDGIGGWRLAR